MKNQYQNWWTIHWLSEFQARWAGAGRAWEEGQVDYEIGKLERADFDGLSGELVGKLFDSNAHPFYRPVLVFAKLNRSDCQTIRQWFQQNESALMDLFNGHLSQTHLKTYFLLIVSNRFIAVVGAPLNIVPICAH